MNLKSIFIFLVSTFIIVSCDRPANDKAGSDDSAIDSTSVEVQNLSKSDRFINSIEQAHLKESFDEKEVIQFDLNLSFGGQSKFDGTISMTPSGSIIKLKDSSRTIIWDDENVFISPDSANTDGARFAVLTWPYFFAAAYKLSDPGTNMEFLGEKNLRISAVETVDSNGTSYNAGKLTFDTGVGDSPEDWYIVYQDKQTDLLAAMAYIVTYGGKDQDEAEEDPHAITYEAYTRIDEIPIATRWNFWTWNQEGELNKLLGEATLSNIKFIKKTADLFKSSSNAKKVEEPEV